MSGGKLRKLNILDACFGDLTTGAFQDIKSNNEYILMAVASTSKYMVTRRGEERRRENGGDRVVVIDRG